MSTTEYRKRLLGKPSVTNAPYCVICGRQATNKHHVVPKGMGGVSRETENRIPKLRLCGNGNMDGCHGAVHQKRLHINWDKSMGGWVFLMTKEPINDEKCWEERAKDYIPVPGWLMEGGDDGERPDAAVAQGDVRARI